MSCIRAILICALATGFSQALAGPLPGIVINEDNSHFFGYRSAEDMTVEGLHAFVDQYAGTKVSHLFLNASAMRTSYDSAVWDAIWEMGEQEVPADNDVAKKWVENARLLNERGLDPYAVWISRCREKGISPWLSMRMNDVHDVDNPKSFMHSTFWVQHPEYRRVPDGAGWTERAFNYGIPEVRQHHMKLVRELLERYDADGLELDWMRFGYHFKPGEEEQGRAILTEFMREARRLADEQGAKRGRRILIGARVPTHPDAAVGLGMDGVEWAKQGLIDLLVPTPFWATADFDIPVELWRERLGDAAGKIVLAPGTEILLRAHPGGEAVLNDIASVRGFASTAWERGADQIYLFNYMDPAPMLGGVEAYRTLLEKGLAAEVVNNAPRRYIVTYRDTVPAGVPANVVLPVEALDGVAFRIHIGPAPKDDAVVFVGGLAERPGVADARFEVRLNGEACMAAEDPTELQTIAGAKRAVRFTCPASAVRGGYNVVSVRQTNEETGQQIVWAEIQVGMP